MSAFEVPSPPRHHIEVLGSVGGGEISLSNDYNTEAIRGGLPMGAVGSYRYSVTRWFEAGATAAFHVDVARDVVLASSLLGAARFRTTGRKAGFVELGAGFMRLDDVSPGFPEHWSRWLVCGQTSLGAIVSDAIVLQLAATVGTGGDGPGSRAYGGNVFFASLRFEAGGRFNL